MGKATMFTLMFAGLILVFYFTGLLQDTPNSVLLNLLLNPTALPTSSLLSQVALAVGGVVTAGVIIVGIFTGNLELAVMGSLTIWLLGVFWDILKVFSIVKDSVDSSIALLLFSPLFIVWVMTMVEWWRGKD